MFVFFQAEDGIRDRSPSRGLGDVYKRQVNRCARRDPGSRRAHLRRERAGRRLWVTGHGSQVTGHRSLPAYERLKLLVVTGKSGTIVPDRARGNAGQLNHDGSTILTRVRRSSVSTSTRWTIVPRHPSTIPTPLRTAPCGSRAPDVSAGVPRKLSRSAVAMRWVASWVEAAYSPARRVNRASTSPPVTVRGVTGRPPVGWSMRASVARPLARAT